MKQRVVAALQNPKVFKHTELKIIYEQYSDK